MQEARKIVPCVGNAFLRRFSAAASENRPLARAVVYEHSGKPSEVLKIYTYRLPPLTSATVYLRFLAAPINPSDINAIEGTYPIKIEYTRDLGTDIEVAVPGNEGCAEVLRVGDDVQGLSVGDWVIMRKTGFGTWRTHCIATPDDVIKLDRSGLGVVQAATLAVNPCTAYRMLRDFVRLEKGDYVLQNGANSAAGQAVIQIAREWGLHTINVVRDRPNIVSLRTHLESLGATHVVTDAELATAESRRRLSELTADRGGARLALNCVCGSVATHMARLMALGSCFVTYGGMARAPLTVPASHLIFRDIRFVGFWMARWNEEQERVKSARSEGLYERERMLADVTQLIRDGKLREPPHEEVWLTDEAGTVTPDEDDAVRARVVEAVCKSNAGFAGYKQVLRM